MESYGIEPEPVVTESLNNDVTDSQLWKGM